jgi:peptidoglycan/xylan/chitin deacetylase (PgdA/CDA1 family)
MSDATWRPLTDELDRWADAGRTARLWLRDDDAIDATPALDRLISATEGAPLLLAVIPARVTPALGERLADVARIEPAVHGWAHANHSVLPLKRELGLDRGLDAVLDDLDRGMGRLREIFGDRLQPVLVPPWNRIDTALLPHLPGLGFRALSADGAPKEGAPDTLRQIPISVDIMDWRRTPRGGRPHAELVAELVEELGRARRSDRAVGVLGHHLVHDETAWGFLEGLFASTCSHAATRWVAPSSLLVEGP